MAVFFISTMPCRHSPIPSCGVVLLLPAGANGNIFPTFTAPDDMKTISKIGFEVGALIWVIALAMESLLHLGTLQSIRPQAHGTQDFADTEPAVHSDR